MPDGLPPCYDAGMASKRITGTPHRHRHHRHSKRAEIAAMRAGVPGPGHAGHAGRAGVPGPGTAQANHAQASNVSWRGSDMTAAERGYDHKWRKARAIFLKSNPLCVFCVTLGRTRASNTVDHIAPHRGDVDLFWDEANWQALCASCHNTTKKEIERRGYSTGVADDGWPTDPMHPVNAKGAPVTHQSNRKKGA